MKRLRAWLGVFLVFIFGVVCGAILSAGVIQKEIRAWLTGGAGRERDPIVKYLDRELHLSPEQQAAAGAVVEGSRHQLEAIKAQAQPSVDVVITGAENQVRALLDEKQRQKFDALVEKNHAKWRGDAGKK